MAKTLAVLEQPDSDVSAFMPGNSEPVLLIVFFLHQKDALAFNFATNSVRLSTLLRSLPLVSILISSFLNLRGRVNHFVVLVVRDQASLKHVEKGGFFAPVVILDGLLILTLQR